MKEGDILKAITDFLTAKGILHWRANLGGVMHHVNGKMIFRKNPMKGFPDIAGAVDGKMFAIEVKKPKTGRQSPEQKDWQEKLEQNGVTYLIATSVDDVLKNLFV